MDKGEVDVEFNGDLFFGLNDDHDELNDEQHGNAASLVDVLGQAGYCCNRR